MIVREARQDDIASVVARMRACDRAEATMLGLGRHADVLAEHIRGSDSAVAFAADGIVLAVSGVRRPALLFDDYAQPWMVRTTDVDRHRKAFLRETRRWMRAWAEIYRTLVVDVPPEDRETYRWLEWLGFRFQAAFPAGTRGEIFHRLAMGTD